MNLSDEIIEQFISAIKSSREFSELKQAKGVIDRTPGIKAQVDEFNRKQLEVFGTKDPKEAEAKASELNKKFSMLSRIPEVERFLKASKKFNELMLKINQRISESIQSELK